MNEKLKKMTFKIEDIKVNKAKNLKEVNSGDFFHGKEIEKKETTKTKVAKVFADKVGQEFAHKRMFSFPRIKKKNKIISGPLIFLISLVILGGLVYIVSKKFEVANIYLVPKNQTINLDKKEFLASKDKASLLNFEIMISSDNLNKDLILTETVEADNKAEGRLVFYNNYSANSQKLLAGEFLSDENGRSYKLKETIIIPGFKKSGDNITPGQIEAEAMAFLSGEAYNGEPKDFTIDVFKNTDKFEKIYAKAVTSFSGGMKGLAYKIGPVEEAQIDEFSRNILMDTLFKKAKAEIPVDYILYKEASNFSYSYNKNELFKVANAKVKIDGNLNLVMFKRDDISKSIIKKIMTDIETKEINQIFLKNIDDLSFSFVDKGQLIDKETTSFRYNFSGEVKANWVPYEDELITKLIGIKKSSSPAVFALDKGVASASIRIFPPWQKYLPADPSRIKMHINQQ